METISIDEVDRITRSFSRAERRRISKVCGAIDRALASSQRAFEGLGERLADRPELSTTLLAVIEPARLEAHVADMERLADFWRAQARTATGRQARVARRAFEDLIKAVGTIEAWLREIDPLIIEQYQRGMPAKRLLPERERERFRSLDQPPTRAISADERRDLLKALRDAARKEGSIVNVSVFHGLCDLADRGDLQAIYALRKIRETVNGTKQF